MADTSGPEWLVEDGIGETRALLVQNGEVLAAKLRFSGENYAGLRSSATLIHKTSGKRRGTAALPSGAEVLVDHLPDHLTEGEEFAVQVTRAPIAEKGRSKLAQGRYCEASTSPPISVFDSGKAMPRFPAGLWEEIWDAASSGEVQFAGGSLIFSVTPAMTLIDVDGDGSPRELALAAVPAIAQWLALFDLGGSIGIDFPTISDKAGRKAVDAALAEALSDWPHERTAMNGFGFVQIVARMEGPSLLHRFAASRTGMCARMALRRAERAQGHGSVLIVSIHPALKAKIKQEWLDELARRTGKQVRIETEPSLALEAPQAQIAQI